MKRFRKVLLVIICIAGAYFVFEFFDAIDDVLRSCSWQASVGFCLSLIGIAFLLFRSHCLSSLENEVYSDKAKNYIFKISKDYRFTSAYSITDFLNSGRTDEFYFWDHIAVPAIRRAVDEYNESHPVEEND